MDLTHEFLYPLSREADLAQCRYNCNFIIYIEESCVDQWINCLLVSLLYSNCHLLSVYVSCKILLVRGVKAALRTYHITNVVVSEVIVLQLLTAVRADLVIRDKVVWLGLVIRLLADSIEHSVAVFLQHA